MAEEPNNPSRRIVGEDARGRAGSVNPRADLYSDPSSSQENLATDSSSPQSIQNPSGDNSQSEENFKKILFRLYEYNRKLLEDQIKETQEEILSISTEVIRDQKSQILSDLVRQLSEIPKDFTDLMQTFEDGILGAARQLKFLSDTTRGLHIGMKKTNYQMELSAAIQKRQEKENQGRLARFLDGITLGIVPARNTMNRSEVVKEQEEKVEDAIKLAVGDTEKEEDVIEMARRFIMRTDYEPGRMEDTLKEFFKNSDMIVNAVLEASESVAGKFGEIGVDFADIFKSLAAGVYRTGMDKEEYAEKLKFILKSLEEGEDLKILKALDETRLQGEERKKFIRDILNYEKHLVSDEEEVTEKTTKRIGREEAIQKAQEYTNQLRVAESDEKKEAIREKARSEGFEIKITEPTGLVGPDDKPVGEKKETVEPKFVAPDPQRVTTDTDRIQDGMDITEDVKTKRKTIREANAIEVQRTERGNPARRRIAYEYQGELSPAVLKAKEKQEEKEAILADLEMDVKNKSDRKIFREKLSPLVVDPAISPLEFQRRAREERFSKQTGLLVGRSLRQQENLGKMKLFGIGPEVPGTSFLKSTLSNIKGGVMYEAASEAKYQAKAARTDFIRDKISSMTTGVLTGGMLNKLLLLIPGIGPALSIAWTVISKTFSGILSVGKFLFSMVGKVFKVLGEVLSKVMELGTALLKGVAKYGTIALVAWVILFKTGLYKEVIPLISKVIKKVAPIVFDIMTKILKVVNESLEGLIDKLNEMLSGGIYDLPKKIFDFFFGINGVFGEDSGFSALSTELGKFGDNLVRVGSILLDAFVELGKAIGDFFMDIAWPLYIKPAFSSFRDSLEEWSKTEFGGFVMNKILLPMLDGVDMLMSAVKIFYNFMLDFVNSRFVKGLLTEEQAREVTIAHGRRIASQIFTPMEVRGMSEDQLFKIGDKYSMSEISKIKKDYTDMRGSQQEADKELLGSYNPEDVQGVETMVSGQFHHEEMLKNETFSQTVSRMGSEFFMDRMFMGGLLGLAKDIFGGDDDITKAILALLPAEPQEITDARTELVNYGIDNLEAAKKYGPAMVDKFNLVKQYDRNLVEVEIPRAEEAYRAIVRQQRFARAFGKMRDLAEIGGISNPDDFSENVHPIIWKRLNEEGNGDIRSILTQEKRGTPSSTADYSASALPKTGMRALDKHLDRVRKAYAEADEEGKKRMRVSMGSGGANVFRIDGQDQIQYSKDYQASYQTSSGMASMYDELGKLGFEVDADGDITEKSGVDQGAKITAAIQGAKTDEERGRLEKLATTLNYHNEGQEGGKIDYRSGPALNVGERPNISDLYQEGILMGGELEVDGEGSGTLAPMIDETKISAVSRESNLLVRSLDENTEALRANSRQIAEGPNKKGPIGAAKSLFDAFFGPLFKRRRKDILQYGSDGFGGIMGDEPAFGGLMGDTPLLGGGITNSRSAFGGLMGGDSLKDTFNMIKSLEMSSGGGGSTVLQITNNNAAQVNNNSSNDDGIMAALGAGGVTAIRTFATPGY